ncbi:hypothetical protein H4Q26_014783 [Puccinia striiformis f. sp. tritici PST-130]|nr:hypothetical protein H4Q26_014783 [Puccinia striiformis f. sp. tritici PST-130]
MDNFSALDRLSSNTLDPKAHQLVHQRNLRHIASFVPSLQRRAFATTGSMGATRPSDFLITQQKLYPRLKVVGPRTYSHLQRPNHSNPLNPNVIAALTKYGCHLVIDKNSELLIDREEEIEPIRVDDSAGHEVEIQMVHRVVDQYLHASS